jgi:hypothetical protein
MTFSRYRKVFQVVFLLLLLISASASWFLEDSINKTLSTAAAIIFSLLLLQSLKMSTRV